ncbi:MAG: hypothetical protein PHT49_06515 [Desulfovibrionales bacterium]|nr:hypothetical protein [Desulfovibrionales bacterium]
MLGGLARRAGAIRQIRERSNCVLLLDAGDSLFGRCKYSPGELPLAGERAEFILESYLDMGYQAINIGLEDWADGDFLMARIKGKKYPFVAANLKGTDPALTLPPSFVVIDVCGCRVGVLGLMNDRRGHVEGHPDIIVSDAGIVIRDIVSRLKKECSLVVMLSNLGTKVDTDIAKEIDGLDIIIESGSGALCKPWKIEDAYICSPKQEGHWLGRFDVIVTPGGGIKQVSHQILILDESIPEDERIRKEIENRF